jgi:hypothetical protein
MSLLGRLLQYLREVVSTIQEVLALDDPLLCECADDRWCADCALLSEVAPVRPWPGPIDPAA